MKSIYTILLLLTATTHWGQSADLIARAAALTKEGKQLYRLEMASWYGTDLFMEKMADKKDNLRGYFSYAEGEKTRALFFDENGTVLGSFLFDSSFSTAAATADAQARPMTAYEKEIYLMRQKALDIANQDTLFVVYKNSSLNLIPLIENETRKVYFITGPSKSGVVLFGNDYELQFNRKNELLSLKRIHQNLIPLYLDKKESENIVGTLHNHSPATGDFITATDICTLLLYGRFTGWKKHIVLSENYVSVWNLDKQTLTLLTKKEWEASGNALKTAPEN